MIVQVELLLNLAAETGEHLFPLGKTIEEQLALLRLDQIDFICFRQQPERLLERNNGAQQIFRRIIALGVETAGGGNLVARLQDFIGGICNLAGINHRTPQKSVAVISQQLQIVQFVQRGRCETAQLLFPEDRAGKRIIAGTGSRFRSVL